MFCFSSDRNHCTKISTLFFLMWNTLSPPRLPNPNSTWNNHRIHIKKYSSTIFSLLRDYPKYVKNHRPWYSPPLKNICATTVKQKTERVECITWQLEFIVQGRYSLFCLFVGFPGSNHQSCIVLSNKRDGGEGDMITWIGLYLILYSGCLHRRVWRVNNYGMLKQWSY